MGAGDRISCRAMAPLRVAELLGSLSLAMDLADGFALEKCLRTTVLASRLARIMGGTTEDQSAVFWGTLLRFLGCTAFAHEEGRFSAGDDITLRRTLAHVDFGRPSDFVARAVRGIAAHAAPVARVRAVGSLLTRPNEPLRHARAQCEVGVAVAKTLQMPEAVTQVLWFRDERWDGRGPRKLGAEKALPWAARVADVADVAELFGWAGGVEASDQELQRRSGGQLDPSLAEACIESRAQLWAGLFESSVWDVFLACEPAPLQTVEAGAPMTGLLGAFSRFADIASVYTLGHSERVASLARAACQALGLSDDECTLAQGAGYVHDLGRVAVPVGIWEKPAPLTAYERERVRTHSQHTETVLRLCPALAPLVELAGGVHERGAGEGYHRRLAISGLPLVARVVAAADVCVALDSVRPQRPALAAPVLESTLRSLADSGELDSRATRAVLDAYVGRTRRTTREAHGLSEREVEVVRLVAVGRTNREIGELLGMSARTAQKHISNVYDHLGLESRAALALFAVERGLLEH
jgi:HD-GYP domain-containing protein (c-di-GMP phosphodiesterase class II)